MNLSTTPSLLGMATLAALSATAASQYQLAPNPNPLRSPRPAAERTLTPREGSTLPAQITRSEPAGETYQQDFGLTPPPFTPSDIDLSQNATQTITPANSNSCNSGGLHADNMYLRVFDLSSLEREFVPQRVDVGIESAVGGMDATQPIRVRLYDSADLNDTLIDANIAHESTVDVADQAGTVLSIPVDGVISSGSMIVEIFTPDGMADGESFVIGSNADGQTAPSYFRADSCVIATPTDLSVLGFPNMHIVLGVSGKLIGLEATLTQNVNKDITPLNAISCNAMGIHGDNWYYRVFDASGFADFTPTSVDIGIESAVGGGDATQMVRLRIFDSNDLIDTLTNTNVVYNSGMMPLADVAATLMNYPTAGAGTCSSGSVIVEFYTPDGLATGESFFMGSNANGQTAPSYLRADGCGITVPTDLALAGAPDMHIVMNITGDVTPHPPFENYCTAVPNSSGSAAILSVVGSPSVAADDLVISAAPVPESTFFLFFYGPNEIQVPFGNGGFRCIGGLLQRMQPPMSGMAGVATRAILPSQYTFMPQTDVNFQCWFRDNSVLPDRFNTSDALKVRFVD